MCQLQRVNLTPLKLKISGKSLEKVSVSLAHSPLDSSQFSCEFDPNNWFLCGICSSSGIQLVFLL